jgi:hypothetical protein
VIHGVRKVPLEANLIHGVRKPMILIPDELIILAQFIFFIVFFVYEISV